MTLHIKKKKKTKKFANKTGTELSTELRSLDNLFKILPNGTLSKNSLREEKSKFVIIDSWIIADILGLEIAIITALKKANNP